MFIFNYVLFSRVASHLSRIENLKEIFPNPSRVDTIEVDISILDDFRILKIPNQTFIFPDMLSTQFFLSIHNSIPTYVIEFIKNVKRGNLQIHIDRGKERKGNKQNNSLSVSAIKPPLIAVFFVKLFGS